MAVFFLSPSLPLSANYCQSWRDISVGGYDYADLSA